jgi:hypothetical protein
MAPANPVRILTFESPARKIAGVLSACESVVNKALVDG